MYILRFCCNSHSRMNLLTVSIAKQKTLNKIYLEPSSSPISALPYGIVLKTYITLLFPAHPPDFARPPILLRKRKALSNDGHWALGGDFECTNKVVKLYMIFFVLYCPTILLSFVESIILNKKCVL